MRLVVPQSLTFDENRVFPVLPATLRLVDRFLLCVTATNLPAVLRRDELALLGFELDKDVAHGKFPPVFGLGYGP
jgi:hypothetical protein